MQFLNPRTYFAFNRIFTSPESSDSLVGLLNAILNSTISYRLVEASVLDVRLAPKLKALEEIDFYISAKDQRDKTYFIGIQLLNVLFYENRALSHTCQHDAKSSIKTEYNALLTELIVITLSDFAIFEAHPDYLNHFQVSENLDGIGSNIQAVFVELPKFNKQQDALQTLLDKWAYFLKYADSLQTVPEILTVEQPIAHAFQLADQVKFTEKELDLQERSLFFIHDQRRALTKATEMGFEQGIAQGRKQAQQALQCKAILALFASGFQAEFIANTLNLPIDQV